MTLPTTTGLRPQQGADGSWSIPGMPGVEALSIEEDTGPVRDWLEELRLPHDWDVLEIFATAEGFSPRRLRFVIADESITRFPGQFRLQPRRIGFTTDGVLLTLAHLGLVIGECRNVRLAPAGEIPNTEGECLIGEAVLYKSTLADKACEGIQRGIFTHVCGVLVRAQNAPQGTGGLAEVALIDQPGCPGARILGAWDEGEVGLGDNSARSSTIQTIKKM